MLRIDTHQTVTFTTRAKAEALAAKLTKDDEVGDVVYVVEDAPRGSFVAVNDAETGDRIGTL